MVSQITSYLLTFPLFVFQLSKKNAVNLNFCYFQKKNINKVATFYIYEDQRNDYRHAFNVYSRLAITQVYNDRVERRGKICVLYQNSFAV